MRQPIFKIGDIIVALNSKVCELNPRIEGNEYKVLGSTCCPECKEELVCINKTNATKSYKIKCAICGDTSMKSNHMWTLASNFRAKEFDPYEELERAIANEDYMRAAELRDKINADHERQRK